MAKLTIVSFYDKLTDILSDYQERILTEKNARLKLTRLISQAQEEGLNINMSVEVLDAINQNPESENSGGYTYENDPSMIC